MDGMTKNEFHIIADAVLVILCGLAIGWIWSESDEGLGDNIGLVVALIGFGILGLFDLWERYDELPEKRTTERDGER